MTKNNSRARNFRTLLLAGLLMSVTGVLVTYAPTLYRTFCALTGYGGTVQRATAPQAPAPAGGETVTVYFDANVAPGLPWRFEPEQRKVEARLGAPTKVYYRAENRSDGPVVARASFNVTPYKAAPYFFKIECFCFTEERLGPHESARMPLVLYVDEQMLKEANTREVREITLSYTFYPQKDLSDAEVKAARDLKGGSKSIDDELEGSGKVTFENDAPRQ